jgi:beta-galactosidase/beta-glucuronidase
MTNNTRNEYPRPDFVRDNWLSLNGEWDFSFDNDGFDRKINVPFSYESKLSGLGNSEFHRIVWYRKEFDIPSAMQGGLLMLNFGAVDYACRVWVNGVLVAEHTGGQTGFSSDITGAARFDKSNVVLVRVEDDHSDLEMLRGKQFWEEKPRSIFYMHTTGIWQSVWLEAVPYTHLRSARMTPLFDEKAIKFDYRLCGCKGLTLEIQISFRSVLVTSVSVQPQSPKGSLTVNLDQPALLAWNFYEDLAWAPETPRLFDVVFNVYSEGRMEDTVYSYFGMRKVSVEKNVFMLNNRPYYQKLVLDQGYWPESLMTAPTDDAFIKDIDAVKAMGFNGVRKHQKVEDPRFLYYADRMGLLVWSEIGAAYLYSEEYAVRMYREWTSAVQRDYNHPCIVAWVPLNESWGVQEIHGSSLQQGHSKALYHITKSLDSTRMVIDNDGWEHAFSDMLTIHDYESSATVMEERYANLKSILEFLPNGKNLYVDGGYYGGEPIIISEYGGIRFAHGDIKENSWGYSEDKTPDGFIAHFAGLVKALQKSGNVQGYCYTQLADVGSEQNGLLTYGHEPKISLAIIKEINDDKPSRSIKAEKE